MDPHAIDTIFEQLKASLALVIDERGLAGRDLHVRCRVLEAAAAIGSPGHRDYPILRGREHMVEARFENARGQAFADEFENVDGPVETLLSMKVDTNAHRAVFVAGLNAVFRHCGLCEKTVHCRDEEPCDCARHLVELFPQPARVLLVGLQPRFLEALAERHAVRVVDLDPQNVGAVRSGVTIEPAEATDDAIDWCDCILATGSTIVNGTITKFLAVQKRTVFFGVTISAAARILQLETFCHAPMR